MSSTRKATKPKTIIFRLDEETFQKIKNISDSQSMSVSQVTIDLLKLAMSQDNIPKY